jgi:hypothetical protein
MWPVGRSFFFLLFLFLGATNSAAGLFYKHIDWAASVQWYELLC